MCITGKPSYILLERSLMCLSICRLGMANPTVASKGEIHCMIWVWRPVRSTNSSLASLWLRQRFPAVSSSFGLEMASVCCLCYLSGLLANVFHFLFETCHRHCQIAEVKPGRAGLVLGWVTATGMLIGSFNTIGERKWLLIYGREESFAWRAQSVCAGGYDLRVSDLFVLF